MIDFSKTKRITVFSGHYGSGKTNLAVNFAQKLKGCFSSVAIADLDIVNPYFRTKDSAKELSASGIRLICSEYAGGNLDIPALPQDMYSIIDDKSLRAIVDLGGDDRGALALGRLTPQILQENDYEMFCVINKYRPLTRDAESIKAIIAEIEAAGKLKFTGLVNNSNLGNETTEEDVINSVKFAEEISKETNLPIKFTSADVRLYEKLKGEIENVFPLELQKKIV